MALIRPGAPAFSSEKEFLADLDEHFGTEKLAPYRGALPNAALQINASAVLYAIIGFVASFAISLGPVMWVLLSEIFPNQYRGMGMSVAGFWNSAISAGVTMVFPWELSHFGPSGTFLIYGAFAVAALVFVLVFIPETKGKSLEELEKLLARSPATAHTTASEKEFTYDHK